jgi:O-acetyl-ADP-ribose deacetylase (regulator of RNase III)
VDAVAGREVRARLSVAGERARAIEAIGTFQRSGDAMVLPDLLLGLPYELPVEVQLEAGDATSDLTLGSIELSWTDPSGDTVDVTVPIVADALDDAAYAAAAEDPDVVVAHVVAVAGRLYDEAMQALDRHDPTTMKARLDELEARLAGAPDDGRIARQRSRLTSAHEAIRMRDTVLTRKRMHAARESSMSRFDHEEFAASGFASMKAAALAERRADRNAHAWGDAPRPSRRPTTASTTAPLRRPYRKASYRIDRPDGSMGRLSLTIGDITKTGADALVNPTNTHLHGSGDSVDGAVHRIGGRELTRECREIGKIELAQAAATKGYRLPADYVVHVAVPSYHGREADFDLLEKAYRSAVDLARQLRIKHLAVPAMGTGTNGFPMDRAAQRAVKVLIDALEPRTSLTWIDVVLLSEAEIAPYQRAIATDGRLAS